jgi:hypothetical protein
MAMGTVAKGKKLVLLLGLIALAGGAIWVAGALLGRKPSGARARAGAPEPSAGQALAGGALDNPRRPTARTAPAIAAAKSAEEAGGPEDPGDVPPCAAEITGQLRLMYEVWNTEKFDPAGTRKAGEFFADAFARYDIRPLDQVTSCRESLCRSRLSFADLDRVLAMSRIPPADVPKFAFSDPEPQQDGASSIVIYWSHNGEPLPEPMPEPGAN